MIGVMFDIYPMGGLQCCINPEVWGVRVVVFYLVRIIYVPVKVKKQGFDIRAT